MDEQSSGMLRGTAVPATGRKLERGATPNKGRGVVLAQGRAPVPGASTGREWKMGTQRPAGDAIVRPYSKAQQLKRGPKRQAREVNPKLMKELANDDAYLYCTARRPNGLVCGRRRQALHHRVFRSKGGGDTRANVVPRCKECHDAEHGIFTATARVQWSRAAAVHPDAPAGAAALVAAGPA